jgi:hypothetical protein
MELMKIFKTNFKESKTGFDSLESILNFLFKMLEDLKEETNFENLISFCLIINKFVLFGNLNFKSFALSQIEENDVSENRNKVLSSPNIFSILKHFKKIIYKKSKSKIDQFLNKIINQFQTFLNNSILKIGIDSNHILIFQKIAPIFEIQNRTFHFLSQNLSIKKEIKIFQFLKRIIMKNTICSDSFYSYDGIIKKLTNVDYIELSGENWRKLFWERLFIYIIINKLSEEKLVYICEIIIFPNLKDLENFLNDENLFLIFVHLKENHQVNNFFHLFNYGVLSECVNFNIELVNRLRKLHIILREQYPHDILAVFKKINRGLKEMLQKTNKFHKNLFSNNFLTELFSFCLQINCLPVWDIFKTLIRFIFITEEQDDFCYFSFYIYVIELLDTSIDNSISGVLFEIQELLMNCEEELAIEMSKNQAYNYIKNIKNKDDFICTYKSSFIEKRTGHDKSKELFFKDFITNWNYIDSQIIEELKEKLDRTSLIEFTHFFNNEVLTLLHTLHLSKMEKYFYLLFMAIKEKKYTLSEAFSDYLFCKEISIESTALKNISTVLIYSLKYFEGLDIFNMSFLHLYFYKLTKVECDIIKWEIYLTMIQYSLLYNDFVKELLPKLSKYKPILKAKGSIIISEFFNNKLHSPTKSFKIPKKKVNEVNEIIQEKIKNYFFIENRGYEEVFGLLIRDTIKINKSTSNDLNNYFKQKTLRLYKLITKQMRRSVYGIISDKEKIMHSIVRTYFHKNISLGNINFSFLMLKLILSFCLNFFIISVGKVCEYNIKEVNDFMKSLILISRKCLFIEFKRIYDIHSKTIKINEKSFEQEINLDLENLRRENHQIKEDDNLMYHNIDNNDDFINFDNYEYNKEFEISEHGSEFNVYLDDNNSVLSGSEKKTEMNSSYLSQNLLESEGFELVRSISDNLKNLPKIYNVDNNTLNQISDSEIVKAFDCFKQGTILPNDIKETLSDYEKYINMFEKWNFITIDDFYRYKLQYKNELINLGVLEIDAIYFKRYHNDFF